MNDKKIKVGYMLIPIDLTDEQEHIFIKLYKKCNFETMEVKYTIEQLVNDSNKCFNLTTKKVRLIMSNLINSGYIEVVKKGSKSNPTIYKINKFTEINGQLKDKQTAIKGQLKGKQNIDIKPISEGEGQLKDKQTAIKGQLKGNPIKEKEKENNIYSDFILKVIRKYPGKKVKSIRDKKLPKIIEQYGEEQIGRCINRYIKECEGKDKQYILNESTFWNTRYIDYLDENYEEFTNNLNKKQKFDATKYYD